MQDIDLFRINLFCKKMFDILVDIHSYVWGTHMRTTLIKNAKKSAPSPVLWMCCQGGCHTHLDSIAWLTFLFDRVLEHRKENAFIRKMLFFDRILEHKGTKDIGQRYARISQDQNFFVPNEHYNSNDIMLEFHKILHIYWVFPTSLIGKKNWTLNNIKKKMLTFRLLYHSILFNIGYRIWCTYNVDFFQYSIIKLFRLFTITRH